MTRTCYTLPQHPSLPPPLLPLVSLPHLPPPYPSFPISSCLFHAKDFPLCTPATFPAHIPHPSDPKHHASKPVRSLIQKTFNLCVSIKQVLIKYRLKYRYLSANVYSTTFKIYVSNSKRLLKHVYHIRHYQRTFIEKRLIHTFLLANISFEISLIRYPYFTKGHFNVYINKEKS